MRPDAVYPDARWCFRLLTLTNLETITAERAKQIIDMNRHGEKPESLHEGGKPKPQRTTVDLAGGDISRFDKTKKKKKKKPRDNKGDNSKAPRKE